MQDPSPQGPPNAAALYMEHHTSATTTPPAGTLQDGRRDLSRTKDEIQDDSDARRLPTVHFLQCSTTVPRDLRENDDFHTPLMCTALPCDYKRRRWASLGRVGIEFSDFLLRELSALLSTHLNRLHL